MRGATMLGGALALLLAAGPAPAAGLTLARDGRTDYDVVLSADRASPSERFAAGELSATLKEITGADFPVVTDDRAGDGPHILVGEGALLTRLAPGLKLEDLGREGYVITTVGPHLVLAGGRMRGSMYAVYGLLEDHLGCRWFTPDCSRIPRSPTLELGALDERRIPALEYREDFYAEGFDGLWAVRNRMNGNCHRITPDMGDKIHYVAFVHTFYPLLPPEKYFRDHPEYYALVGGKRTATNAQLCLTNPEVVRLVTEQVRAWLRDAKAKGLPDDVIVSVSQNDCWGWCECPRCAAVAKDEGSQSGPILRFVNQVADGIKDEFPLATVDTLAYSYSRKPPKHVQPRPNVVVRLCSIECCFSHPLDGCAVNRSFMDDLRGWRQVSKRLYVWDYVTDFGNYIMPFPDLRVLGPNIKTFAAHNVRGIFEEGNYHGGGEFCYLRTYLLAKALWDPTCDMNRAMDEFLDGYYGPAAPFLRRYIDLLHDTVEREQIHVFIWTGPGEKYLRPEILDKADALFGQAEAAVRGDDRLLLRVHHARMPLMYTRLCQNPPRYRLDFGVFTAQGAGDRARIADAFAGLARTLGIGNINEGRPMADYLAELSRGAPDLPVLRIATADLRLDLIPGRGGRIFGVFDRVLGRQLMHRFPEGDPAYPGGSGYTDWIGTDWPGAGTEDPWQVGYTSDRVAEVHREADGYRQTRRVEILPDAPVVVVTADVKNIGAEPRETLIRVHPNFAMGSVDDCMVSIPQKTGGAMRVNLRDLRDDEKDLFMDGPAMPAGWWSVMNRKYNYALRCDFDPSQFSKALLNYSRSKRRVNLELYSRTVTLKPGETLSVTYRWEVQRKAKP